MRSRARATLAALGVALGVTACAGRHIEHGVFYSPKGYHVTLPSDGWTVVPDARADVELRRDGEGAGMLANAACSAPTSRASLELLARHLLVGIGHRGVVTSEHVSLGGHEGWHEVVAGRRIDGDEPVKVEAYVIRGNRCLYDFLYAAPPATFDRWRPDFQTLVTTLGTD